MIRKRALRHFDKSLGPTSRRAPPIWRPCVAHAARTLDMRLIGLISWPVMDDDRVFKALADATRRLLLDRLFQRDGLSLTALEADVSMTRFGVAKHLRVLEEAGLVVTRRSGREKLHFLNPVPIRLIHDRWIDKYSAGPAAMLADLKNRLENEQ
jgi:DNA-binding transcriptional ArsR family regulator